MKGSNPPEKNANAMDYFYQSHPNGKVNIFVAEQ
jgi:hypothetical protein